MGFVTGFRGRRDGYQVPAALAEADQLDAFVTDHYVGPLERGVARLLPRRHAEKLLARSEPLIPPLSVVRLRGVAAMEAAYQRVVANPNRLYARFDPLYGEAMAAAARRHGSDLLAYSAYAEAAFAAAPASARKVLFQYHPHIQLEQAILRADAIEPGMLTLDSGLDPHPVRISSDESWRMADQIVCASSFTSRSLVEAGADPARISVIPYGVDLPAIAQPVADDSDRFRALFVGTGLHRKGLHHLLRAWSRRSFCGGGQLVVVARAIEPELLELVRSTPDVVYHPGVDQHTLHRLYKSATLFVMPSLVEGFGQVYLEALAHGLPVLGTANTCLPDLGDEDDGIFLTRAGDPDDLASQLDRLGKALVGNTQVRQRARAAAERYQWSDFRASLASFVTAS